MYRPNFVFTFLIPLLLLGCATHSNIPSAKTELSEFDYLMSNSRTAKLLAEKSENLVRNNWGKLRWTNTGDGSQKIGSYVDSNSGRTMIARISATNEYFGQNSADDDYAFGCEYTFGNNRTNGYIGRTCGQNKNSMWEGWGTYEQSGKIFFLEYHSGKINGPGLSCQCKPNECMETRECIEQWYSNNKVTNDRIRNYPQPPKSSLTQIYRNPKIGPNVLFKHTKDSSPKLYDKWGVDGVNRIDELLPLAAQKAATSPACDMVDTADIATLRSTPGNPIVFFVDCNNKNRFYINENELGSNGVPRSEASKTAGLGDRQAIAACESEIKTKLNNPLTFDRKVTSVYRAPYTGNVVVQFMFESKNNFGGILPSNARCVFSGNGIESADITN